ncbi:MAG: DUF790 family protein [Leptolyngbya sp. SIO4C5]|nr:DUF790 family protein [Leptolyngbya sp. SIO4C5]
MLSSAIAKSLEDRPTLTSDLLIYRLNGESVTPKRLALTAANLQTAEELITLFQQAVDQPQSRLNQQLQEIEGEETDYRIKRGLAHLLRSGFSTFDIVSPLEPIELRQRVFALSAQSVSSPSQSEQTLTVLAQQLSQELERDVEVAHIRQGLYADLQENRILVAFDPPTPAALLHRYNLSQVQGVFYRASQITLNVHRNDPGEYKLMFRYLKLFRLMTYIEGDADHGFTIAIDGPTSLFKASTRYGLDIAKLIPAILHVTRWSLTATLQIRDSYSNTTRQKQFTLDADCGLVSHYPPGKPYDSLVEAAFADRWSKLKTPWQLEREVDLIPLPGSAMIPDFKQIGAAIGMH